MTLCIAKSKAVALQDPSREDSVMCLSISGRNNERTMKVAKADIHTLCLSWPPAGTSMDTSYCPERKQLPLLPLLEPSLLLGELWTQYGWCPSSLIIQASQVAKAQLPWISFDSHLTFPATIPASWISPAPPASPGPLTFLPTLELPDLSFLGPNVTSCPPADQGAGLLQNPELS